MGVRPRTNIVSTRAKLESIICGSEFDAIRFLARADMMGIRQHRRRPLLRSAKLNNDVTKPPGISTGSPVSFTIVVHLGIAMFCQSSITSDAIEPVDERGNALYVATDTGGTAAAFGQTPLTVQKNASDGGSWRDECYCS
eukprot:4035080-Amphidinium_carterae.1